MKIVGEIEKSSREYGREQKFRQTWHCGSWRLQNETSSSWPIELLLSSQRWHSILYYENDRGGGGENYNQLTQRIYEKLLGNLPKVNFEFRRKNRYWCQGLRMYLRESSLVQKAPFPLLYGNKPTSSCFSC